MTSFYGFKIVWIRLFHRISVKCIILEHFIIFWCHLQLALLLNNHPTLQATPFLPALSIPRLLQVAFSSKPTSPLMINNINSISLYSSFCKSFSIWSWQNLQNGPWKIISSPFIKNQFTEVQKVDTAKNIIEARLSSSLFYAGCPKIKF